MFDGIYESGSDGDNKLDSNEQIDFEYLFEDPFEHSFKYLNDVLRFMFRNFNQEFLKYRRDFQFENHTFAHLIEYIYNLQSPDLFAFDENQMQDNICNLVYSLQEDKKNLYSDLCLDYPSKIDFNGPVNKYFHSLYVDSKECYKKNKNNILISQDAFITKDKHTCEIVYNFQNYQDSHAKKLLIDNFVLPARNLDTCKVEFSPDGTTFTELKDGANKLLGQRRSPFLDFLPEFLNAQLEELPAGFPNQVDNISRATSTLTLLLNSVLVDLLLIELDTSGGRDFASENNEMSDIFNNLLKKNVSDIETMFYIMKSELFLDSAYNTLYDLLRLSIADFEQEFNDLIAIINRNSLFEDVADNLEFTNDFFHQVSRYNFPLRLFSNDDLYSRFASTFKGFNRFAHNDNGLIASFITNEPNKKPFLEDRFRFSPQNNYLKLRNSDISEFVYQPTINKIPLTYFDDTLDNVKSYFARSLNDSIPHNDKISLFLFNKSKDWLENDINNLNCNQDCVDGIIEFYPNINSNRSTYLNTLSYLINDFNLGDDKNTLINKGFEFVSKYRTQDLLEDVFLQNGNALEKVFGDPDIAIKTDVIHGFYPDSLLYLPFGKKGRNIEPFDMNKTVDNFSLMLNEFEMIIDEAELENDYKIYYELIIDDFKNYINEIKSNVSLFYDEFSTPALYDINNSIESGRNMKLVFRISPKNIEKNNSDCEIYFPNPHMSGMPSEFNNQNVFGGALMSTNDEFATTNISPIDLDELNFKAVRYLYKAPQMLSGGSLMSDPKSACELYSPSQTFDEVFPNVND